MDELEKNKSEITGFIIAGGKSERFGSDKRKLLIAGQSLISRSIDLMKSFLGRDPFVVGDNFEGIDVGSAVILKDAQADSGPLGGLVSSLENCDTKWALVMAVDLPNINAGDLEVLLGSRDATYDIITLSTDARPEPLIALYQTRTVPYWRGRLARKKLGLSEGIIKLKYKTVIPGGGEESLRNINDPKDIKGLKK